MGRSGRMAFTAIPIAFIAFVVAVTAVASSRGACGGGGLRPSCGMFATGVVFYSLIAVDLLSALTALVLLVLRRRPPRPLIISCVLFVAAILSLLVPLQAVGNKLAGAVVVMFVFPLTVLLAFAASICSLVCLAQTINAKRPV